MSTMTATTQPNPFSATIGAVLDAARHGRCSHEGMSTKSKARMARRHPEQVKEVSEKVVAAEIVTGLLSAITFGTIDDGPKSASGKPVSHRRPEV